MILNLFLYAILGIFLGIFTGFIPGLSINSLFPILINLNFLSSLELSVFIVSCSITQILAQFLPSIFLGAPNENSAISILPGHRLLLEGRGYEAYKICLISCLISLVFSLIFLLFLQPVFKEFYYLIREYVFYLIFFVSIFMILTERYLKRIFLAFLIFLLSGFLGLFVLNSPYPSTNLMFPMLSGLFGISTLVLSLKEKSSLPKQKIDEEIKFTKKELIKSSFVGTLFGLIVGFLPGVGVSQAAVVAQTIFGLSNPRSFLSTVSSINLANEIFSLNSLYLVGNPRSGTSVAIQKIVKELDAKNFYILIFSIVFVSGLAIPFLLFLSKKLYKFLLKLNYFYLNISIIIFLTFSIYYFTGLFGILVALTSTSIGLLTVEFKVKRSHCMGCLLFPTMLFFSGYSPMLLGLLF